jgi:hypothetical protein
MPPSSKEKHWVGCVTTQRRGVVQQKNDFFFWDQFMLLYKGSNKVYTIGRMLMAHIYNEQK